MKKAVPTGICGLLCVCFSQIALFASERTVGWLFAAFAAACLLFSALSVRAGSFAARLAWLLPPALLLIPAFGRPAFWILLAAWVVFLFLCCSDQAFQTYRAVRRFFPIPAGFSIFAVFMMSLRSLGVSFHEFVHCDPLTVCGFAVAGLVLLSVTLLSLRAGCPEHLRWKAQSLAGTMLPVLSGGLLVLLIPVLGVLGQLLMKPFVLLFSLISLIMSQFLRPATMEAFNYAPTETQAAVESTHAPNAGPLPDLSGIRTKNANSQLPWAEIGTVVGIVLVVVIVTILLIRFLRRPRERSGTQPALAFAPEKMDVPKRVRRSRKRSFVPDNAQRIREIFRVYLRLRVKAGQEILPSQTSLEILNDPARGAAADAEISLRRLYLRARYAGPDSLNKADVTAAESLLRELSSEEASHSN